MIFSRLVVFISSSVPRRLGMALKNQIWTTGAANSMWPMRTDVGGAAARRGADAAVGDLDAAAVADHALVLHAAVLAAGWGGGGAPLGRLFSVPAPPLRPAPAGLWGA